MIPRRKPYFNSKTISKVLDMTVREDEPEKLARDLKNILGLPNPIPVASGRIGLRLILESAELPPGSEIILPAYTFGLLTKSIEASGFKPVPVDIDPKTFQMDPKAAEKAINKRTRAIIATHLFGEPCDIPAFVSLAKKNKLLLIEDCAESLGSRFKGRPTGTFGDAAIGSFNIAKPLQGITGGVVFGKNAKLIKAIRKRVASAGRQYETPWKDIVRGLIGYVATLTPFWYLLMYILGDKKAQKIFVKSYRKVESGKKTTAFSHKLRSVYLHPVLARIVRLNVPSLERRAAKRRQIRDIYEKGLEGVFKFPISQKGSKGNAYLIPAVSDKDPFELRRHLAIRGIDIAIREEIADNILKKKRSVTKEVFDKAIALPVYESLKEKSVQRVIKALKSYRGRASFSSVTY